MVYHLRWYSRRMATSHPRIAVVHDDQLDRALRIAEPLLSAAERRSQASRVRALAIRGAEVLAAEHGGEGAPVEAALGVLGATRATAPWSELPSPIVAGDPADRPGSAALNDVRGTG